MIQNKPPLRILLIDELPIYHFGLRRVLSAAPDLTLARCVTSLSAALPAPAIDLVVLDIAATRSKGIAGIRELKTRLPLTPILVLTGHDERLFAERCLKAGAAGFLMKTAGPDVVVAAIRDVAQGILYVSNQIKSLMLKRLTVPRTAPELEDFDRLSDRELLIVEQIGLSKNNKEIARELQISVKTIESHRSRIKAKLRLESPQELMRYAMRLHQS